MQLAKAVSCAIVLGLVVSASMVGQAPPKPVMVEDVFKNVQLLKGITVTEFMETMGFFSASLGMNCIHCHVNDSLTHWEKFAEDVPRKRVARRMIQMVDSMNKANFGGRRVLTCNTCHRGGIRPEPVPNLAVQYGLPAEDPNAVEITPDAPPGPSASEILDRYLLAVGGADRANQLKSFVAKGTYSGYDSYEQQVPFEIYAQSPLLRTTVAHTQNGDSTVTYDGRTGWVAAVDKPVTLVPMTGSELDIAKVELAISFPSHLKEALRDWKVGFPIASIDGNDVQVVQGSGNGGTRVKLYFDVKTGLLVRSVRYTETIVGTIPSQVDYSDYREVTGVKLPFRWTVTWTDGKSDIRLSEIAANISVDAARFSRPAPAVIKPQQR